MNCPLYIHDFVSYKVYFRKCSGWKNYVQKNILTAQIDFLLTPSMIGGRVANIISYEFSIFIKPRTTMRRVSGAKTCELTWRLSVFYQQRLCLVKFLNGPMLNQTRINSTQNTSNKWSIGLAGDPENWLDAFPFLSVAFVFGQTLKWSHAKPNSN